MLNGQVQIVGLVGRPLGTVVEIHAEVIEDRSAADVGAPSPREDLVEYKLRVVAVDNIRLQKHVDVSFSVVPIAFANVAPNRQQLDDLVERMQTAGARERFEPSVGGLIHVEPVSKEAAMEFLRDYVGSEHELIAFETAEYIGLPENTPDDAFGLSGAQSPFHLRSKLVIIGERFGPKPSTPP